MEILLHLWKPVVEILILWYVFYQIILYLEGTRALYVLRGIVIILVAFMLFKISGLYTLKWLFDRIFALSIVVFVILFQAELRQGLARLGQNPLFDIFPLGKKEIRDIARDITIAVSFMAERRIGALIAIERQIGLKGFSDTGIKIDGLISPEIIETIFYSGSPLHDGGVIIRGNRIVAASCLFPLTDSERHSEVRGTRHRAAIGITEETDAICIVVSEETGRISTAVNGRLKMELKPDELYDVLVDALSNKKV